MMKSQPLISNLPFSYFFVSFSGLSFFACYLPSRLLSFLFTTTASSIAVFPFFSSSILPVISRRNRRRLVAKEKGDRSDLCRCCFCFCIVIFFFVLFRIYWSAFHLPLFFQRRVQSWSRCF